VGTTLSIFPKKKLGEKMKNEVLPVGTEALLRRLGYTLDAKRTEWRPTSDSDLPAREPDILTGPREAEHCL
jgi:hypothetical protein